MKFGFELELFCISADDKPCLVPAGLPYDECGWLVEVRSEPHSDVRKALALLNAELECVDRQAAEKGIKLLRIPLMEIPRDLKVEAARRHMKGLIQYQNIYGHQTHRCPARLQTASLHVSLTNEQVRTFSRTNWAFDGKFIVKQRETEEFRYQGFIDHAKLIVGFDVAFAADIRKAQRNPGFYEVKPDGRIEYRSLPNNVDLVKVGDVLEKLVGER